MKTTAKRFLADLNRDQSRRDEAPFDIRLAGTADHGAVCKLIVSACRELQWSLPPAAYMVYVTDLLDLEARLGASQLLLGEFQDRPVGTVACEGAWAPGRPPWPSSFAGLRALAVLPEARGHGVGAALLEEAMGRARSFGATAIGVHTPAFQTASVDFYRHFGFERAPAFDYDAFRAYGIDLSLPLEAYVAKLA